MTQNGGFILVETTLASVITGLAIVALVPTFLLTMKAAKIAEQTKVATQLSTELLEEIRLRRWDELTPLTLAGITLGSLTLGIDPTETASDKRTFEDIDDFNGWTETSIRDPLMQTVSGFTGYSRSVTVTYVTSAMATSALPTDYKQVHVCTTTPKKAVVCLDTLLTNR